jgi:hypothetical protein
MCLYSGAKTISFTAATSLPVRWPGLVRGHDERSESSHAFSARLQAWRRPGSSPDGGQGKEGFGAGDGAKEAGFGLSFWEANSIEGEAGGTKQGEQEAHNGGEHSRALLPTRAGSSASCLSWSNGSVVTTGRSPRRRQVETVDRGI